MPEGRIAMKEELLQELRKAFYSGNTAIIQTTKNQLNSLYGITSTDNASKYEKVMDTLFIFTKSRAEDLLRIKYYNIASFVSNILNMVFYVNKEPTINYTLELLSEYTGSVEMLWDLGAIDQTEAEEYFSFAGVLRAELILYKYE